MQSIIQGLVNILIFVIFLGLLLKLIWMKVVKKLKFVVKREDTGRLARIEIEAKNQVFDLLESSRLPLNFEKDAILCMRREGDDNDVNEVTNLNEIADSKVIWIVKKKFTEEISREDGSAFHSIGRTPSKFTTNASGQHPRKPTQQEKLLKKLKMQAMKNETERVDGKSTMLGNFDSAEYVVLLGDVGSGKSTVVEKLTGEKERSSDCSTSCTKTSEPFCVPDGSLIISDTPGSNAMDDELEHNVWIATAFNYKPVSKLFIVVKAENRKDNVIHNISEYANRFLEPAEMDVLGVLVTHMDKVKWTEEEFKHDVERKLGIDTVVFSGMDTLADTLLDDILKTCTKKHNLTVDDENFFKFFKLHSNQTKILRSTHDEVKRFSTMKKNFDEARKGFTGKDLVDLVFEFQAYMTDQIVQAQQRLSEKNNFTFYGDGATYEAGHVANMVNQLRTILFDIRVECVGFQSEHGVSELRKCPHCGLIWTKVEGCDGTTTCGNRPSSVNDIRDSAFSVLATFSFEWIGNKLNITKGGSKNVKSEKSSSSNSAGCGKSINWSDMATVAVPDEFSETVKVCTNDIKMLPPSASGFQDELANLLQKAKGAMRLSSKPSEIKD
ncbi:uncharacterized protein LOC114521179 [Dendronephthya gigantea]|uniref:uncharacterized protein LOC114521179 n=1 Tax=Dendronephthya gigantea TaxID=151771 RepID=UPI00106CD849|nr:uncharacterized protein LOC114521179 [Dendronephthya gigantea]